MPYRYKITNWVSHIFETAHQEDCQRTSMTQVVLPHDTCVSGSRIPVERLTASLYSSKQKMVAF